MTAPATVEPDRRLRRVVRQASAETVWAELKVRARDVTTAMLFEPAIVLAAHPDDETLGCGATIMRKRDAGTPVVVAVATDGDQAEFDAAPAEVAALRTAELAEATARLGLGAASVVRWALPDGALAAHADRLTDAIRDLVAEHRPAVVFSTAPGDPHPDHASLGRATHRALAGTGTAFLAYPIWQWHRPRSWVRALPTRRPSAVRIGSYEERKRHALAAYVSQLSEAAGGTARHGLDPSFLRWFLRGPELFLPVADDGAPRP